jgi:hypothetical protein
MRAAIAYILIAVLLGGATSLVIWLRYNMPEARYRRQKRQDREKRG